MYRQFVPQVEFFLFCNSWRKSFHFSLFLLMRVFKRWTNSILCLCCNYNIETFVEGKVLGKNIYPERSFFKKKYTKYKV